MNLNYNDYQSFWSYNLYIYSELFTTGKYNYDSLSVYKSFFYIYGGFVDSCGTILQRNVVYSTKDGGNFSLQIEYIDTISNVIMGRFDGVLRDANPLCRKKKNVIEPKCYFKLNYYEN